MCRLKYQASVGYSVSTEVPGKRRLVGRLKYQASVGYSVSTEVPGKRRL